MPVIVLSLESENNNWYFPSDGEPAAKLDIEAKYSDSSCTFDIIAAYYNENNALIGYTSYSRSTSGAYIETMEQPIADIPADCAYVKAFVWTSISTPIPLSNADTVLLDRLHIRNW